MTRRVALLGKPLRRRHSQVMHDAAFDAAGIDARYVLMELEADEVEGAVAAARGPDWLGLGVTAPYKPAVAALCDEVEADAAEIGAVNNVVRTDDGRLVGINTDAPGFVAGAELAMGLPLRGSKVVVAGAGGVARAIVHACLCAGVDRVTVASRDPGKAAALVEGARRRSPVQRTDAIPLADARLTERLRDADLAVNATTVGMVDPGMALPVEAIADWGTVFDCVYVPAETPLVAAARARGLKAANGSEMLIAQAAIAFERWTGVGGMAEVMRTAVAPLLADPAARA
jgi:shikimate dehydrogenase